MTQEEKSNVNNIHDINLVENKPEISFIEAIIPETADLSDGVKVKIEAGIITIDKQTLEAEKLIVVDFLKKVIETSNENEMKNFLWYLEDSEDQESIEFKNQIQEAFKNKNANSSVLKNLHVHLPTEQIAQRRLIKEKLRSEIEKYPFIFTDKLGNVLSPENDLDFVFMVNEKNQSFKMVVAAEAGIESVSGPENIQPNQYQPDLAKVLKDPKTGYIVIPLLPSKDGSLPSVKLIEIRKGEIDLPEQLLNEEEQNKNQNQNKTPNNIYTPTPPSPITQPRSQRPSSYVSVSH